MDTSTDKDGSVLDIWRNTPVVSNPGNTSSAIITKSPVIYTMPPSGYSKQLSAYTTMPSPISIMQASTSTTHASTSIMPSSMYTIPAESRSSPTESYTSTTESYTSSTGSRTFTTEPYTSPTGSRTFTTEAYTSPTGYRTFLTEPYTSPTGSHTLPTEPYISPQASHTIYKPLSVMISKEDESLSNVPSQTTTTMNLSADKIEVKPPSKPSFSTLHRRRLSAQYRYTGTPLIKYPGCGPAKNIGAIPRPVPISRPAPIILPQIPQMPAIGNPMLSPYHNITAMTQPIFNPNTGENMMSYFMNQMIYQQYCNNGQGFLPSLQPQLPQQQQATDGGMVHGQGQHMFPHLPGLPRHQFYDGTARLPMPVPSPFGYAAAAAETPRWQNNAANTNMIVPPPRLLLPFTPLSSSLLQQQQQQQQQLSAPVSKTTATAVRNDDDDDDDYTNESYLDSCTGVDVTLPPPSDLPMPPKYNYRHREKYWPRSPPPPYVAGKRRDNSDWPPRSPPPPYAEWDSERRVSSSRSRYYYPDRKKARRYSPT